MSNPQNYTVGWICALSTEYVAAQEFLDEEHEPPESVPVHDHNDYTLGKIGKHNVAIAVLPGGEYGTSSAARVAKDMFHSFPNIRIGLMVGIGGGAPSKHHDIRLGDVVVSLPSNGKAAVLQYDFGKEIQDQSFKSTGILNQPPPILLTAVSGLKTHYERKGHKIQDAIRSILKKNPRLLQKYGQPDPKSDMLYKSTVVHPLDYGGSCAGICDNASNLKQRLERPEDQDNPTIHYGRIASANRLMKDALERDRLAAEEDILCFEMEAAGLMNHFPCLVIRGICDYSDSHKNREWQGYAAMTAAAYAKDLLYRIVPNKVEAEQPIAGLLSEVQKGVEDAKKDIEEVLQIQHTQEDNDILRWLTPVEYHSQQHDFISKRQPSTGQWLLELEEFQAWLNAPKQTLFCHGIPGAGKTILTSIVIDDLCRRYSRDRTIQIAYIYGNFRQQGTQKVDDLVASLLKQLAQGHSSLPAAVRELYHENQVRKTRPSREDLIRILHVVVTQSSKVFIILDALDELFHDCRTKLLPEIFKIQAKANLNIFMTSRPILDVEKEFRECISRKSLEIRAKDEDVESYLESHISELRLNVPENVKEEIKKTISEAAKGMFLLVELYFGFLQDTTTIREVRGALRKFRPKAKGESSEANTLEALNDAYNHTMKRINEQPPRHRELAIQVLSWITCAKRPLTTLELQHGLAVMPNDSELDEENIHRVDTIIAVCHGLVMVDKESRVTRLVHYTTQEYFEKHRNMLPAAETDIAMRCITYLSFNVFKSGCCPTNEMFDERLKQNPLFGYAARHWGYHLKEASPEAQRKIPEFLENEASRTPLSWASENGHEDVARLLIEKGAAVDSTDEYGRTPLSWASGNGHEDVVRLLIEKGAELLRPPATHHRR
ncbi:uncharacterized protein Z518_06746 [Rhinocladiella mackenziei CBS 650.93]|uniref:Nucleoside phosphorylase domain-containing protein n=1 Tax=Rhinocladiella mackenziei CBS 650.93 TaxID=1442369 RepID=A0A0D2IBJ7_9EURO|nr:uncharacterized protein Z518_06746 [Rhinocladiella mackenziei CBS 650.93]KIX03194.1 hypothetical protein Z518_06746 [Rhinocladiella mackenziei CBS 650.93]